MPTVKFQKFQIVRGGAEVNVTLREKKLLQILLDNSPKVVEKDYLTETLLVNENYLSKIISSLRPICTMENCIIENIKDRGYRITKVEAVRK